MHNFDIFLESVGEQATDGSALLSALGGFPHLHVTVDDPSRFVYQNADTSVHFVIIVDRRLLPQRDAYAENYDYDEDGDAPPYRDVLPDESDINDFDYDDEDDAYDDEDAEADVVTPIDTPVLTISVPLFRPTFFVAEAMHVIETVRAATDLSIVDPQEGGAGDGEPGAWNEEDIAKSWKQTHLRAINHLKHPEALQVWSDEQCRSFYAYGTYRPKLLDELRGEEIDAPLLQPALHDKRTKSLFIWNLEKPTVVPQSDLVILQLPRKKRGFFGRKTVIDEVLIPGEAVWDLLTQVAEFRGHPTPHLVLRDPRLLPESVVAALDDLPSEPASNARRTELAGVVDFDLSPLSADVDSGES